MPPSRDSLGYVSGKMIKGRITKALSRDKKILGTALMHSANIDGTMIEGVIAVGETS